MKSHPYIYAIIGLILIVLIIAGSIFYYRIISDDGTAPVTNNSNLFGTSTQNTGTSNPGYSGSNTFSNPYVDGVASTDGQQGTVRVLTAPSYANFSQTFTTYRAPTEPQSTPYSSEGIPESQAQRPTPTQTAAATPADDQPIYTYAILYNRSTGTTTPVRITTTRRPQNNNDDDGNPISDFHELDQVVFGYVTGLGWTQYLGSIGEGAFNSLYGLTPQGSTGSTLGGLLGGAFGGGGAGGFGGGGFGGGGGALQNFGTNEKFTITNITECTCMGSRLLDMTDVRGYQLSLLVTPATMVKEQANSMYGIHVNQSAVGDYAAGGACLVYHGEECSSEGNAQGTIRQIGTSF